MRREWKELATQVTQAGTSESHGQMDGRTVDILPHDQPVKVTGNGFNSSLECVNRGVFKNRGFKTGGGKVRVTAHVMSEWGKCKSAISGSDVRLRATRLTRKCPALPLKWFVKVFLNSGSKYKKIGSDVNVRETIVTIITPPPIRGPWDPGLQPQRATGCGSGSRGVLTSLWEVK